MTRKDLYPILAPLIKQITGIPTTIFINNVRNDGARSPSGNYATINPNQTLSEIGHGSIENKNSLTVGKIDQTIKTNILTRCSVNFYRGDALEYAEKYSKLTKLIMC